MLVQKSTAPNIVMAADVPVNTVGTLSYGTPVSYQVSINGAVNAGLGIITNIAASGSGCTTTSINPSASDFPAVGAGSLQLLDAGGNVVGNLPIQVVNFNPYV